MAGAKKTMGSMAGTVKAQKKMSSAANKTATAASKAQFGGVTKPKKRG